jgi:hypothetical protein
MKQSLLALAVLGAFAGVAHAQSSITLYGIIDQGINLVTNVKTATGSAHLYDMSSGVMQGSRWGLRGTESKPTSGTSSRRLCWLASRSTTRTGAASRSRMARARVPRSTSSTRSAPTTSCRSARTSTSSACTSTPQVRTRPVEPPSRISTTCRRRAAPTSSWGASASGTSSRTRPHIAHEGAGGRLFVCRGSVLRPVIRFARTNDAR